MTRMTLSAAAAITLTIVGGIPATHAQTDPQTILQRVDEVLNKWENLRIAITITTRDPDSGQKIVQARRLMDPNRQVLQFTGSDELKNTELRTSSSGPPILYAAQADSERVITDLNEPLPGTFLPIGYFIHNRFSDRYRAHMISNSPKGISLRLEATDPGVLFPRIDVVVDPKRYVLKSLRYFRVGKPLLIETRREFVAADETFVPRNSDFRMGQQHRAKIFVRKVKANVEIPELDSKKDA